MNAIVRSEQHSRRRWTLLAMVVAASAVPLAVLTAIGGYILGLVLITIVPVLIVLVAVFTFIDKMIFDSKVRRSIARRDWFDDRATVIGAPTVKGIKYQGQPFNVEIADADGICPLSINSEFAWSVGADGTLSSPMCAPAAAAVRRIVRVGGVASGTSESCRCPLGRDSVRFRIHYS